MLNQQLVISVMKFVVSSSAAKVTKDILRNNLCEPETTLRTVQYWIGTRAVAETVGFVTAANFARSVNEGLSHAEKIQEKLAEQKVSKEETH